MSLIIPQVIAKTFGKLSPHADQKEEPTKTRHGVSNRDMELKRLLKMLPSGQNKDAFSWVALHETKDVFSGVASHETKESSSGVAPHETKEAFGGVASQKTKEVFSAVASHETKEAFSGVASHETKEAFSGVASQKTKDVFSRVASHEAKEVVSAVASHETKEAFSGVASHETKEAFSGVASHETKEVFSGVAAHETNPHTSLLKVTSLSKSSPDISTLQSSPHSPLLVKPESTPIAMTASEKRQKVSHIVKNGTPNFSTTPAVMINSDEFMIVDQMSLEEECHPDLALPTTEDIVSINTVNNRDCLIYSGRLDNNLNDKNLDKKRNKRKIGINFSKRPR